MIDVQGRCPACGGTSLFLGDGGYVTCARLDCPQPDAATEVIADFWQARQHAGFTFCPQDVGHVTMTEFAKKITEKVTAVAQCAEAVQYANQQKQRADHAEAANDRIRRLAARIRRGVPWAANFDDLADRILAALDAPPADDTPPVHVGGRVNAEDCPACSASVAPPPYPWIRPGEEQSGPAATQATEPATKEN